jgi:hypothetical protein
VARQAPTEAAVRDLRAAFKDMSSATTGSVEYRDAVGDCRQYGAEGVALCDSWLAQRDEIERLEYVASRHDDFVAVKRYDKEQAQAELAAQRDVVAELERKANEKLDYPLVCPGCEARKELEEAARESVRREATSDYGSIYEAPTRIIGPIRDALARFDCVAAVVSGTPEGEK